MFWVYILRCNDRSYYSYYTSARLPIQLMYTQGFNTREEAVAAEKQIHGWGRKTEEELMRIYRIIQSANTNFVYASRRRCRSSSARTVQG